MRTIGNSRLWFAVVAAALFFGASAVPVKTAVFTGLGPRGRGCVSWLQLVESSPELDLMLVDAAMIRAGALDRAELLIIPGGASVVEKKDLGPEGAARIRDFVRQGGGYIGTCAGCCLALEETGDPDRGIGLIPYNRIGNKDGFMMPIALNEKGAAALGMAPGEYKVSYHAGPVLVPSTNAVPDAKVEVWATYASDFDCPKSKLKMFGNIALVGGTYGKGRLFAIACHPEANVFSLGLVKGAFRFVLGREVTFPTRIRRPRSLVVGAFSSGMGGVETARALLDIDACEGVDFFPMTSDEILTGQLDRVDYLVLPAGYAPFYKLKFSGQMRELVETFAAAGGKVLAWGNAADFAPPGTRVFASAGECIEFIRREGAGPMRQGCVSARYRTPGIIGGMGPAATCDLMKKVVDCTDAADDQHHIHMLIDQNTDVPDRTAAILKGGADPMPQLIASAKRLESAGADFLCMSCNTAHYFHERLQRHVGIPILNMPKESAQELKRRGVKKVGLLATDGTIQTRVYHRFLEAEGVEVVLPNAEGQKTVMHLIYGCVKKGVPVSAYPKEAVAAMISDLKDRGAEAFLMACTELPIAFEALGYSEGFVDPTLCLAHAIIREAGAKVAVRRAEPSLK